jgi:hypothetical protein
MLITGVATLYASFIGTPRGGVSWCAVSTSGLRGNSERTATAMTALRQRCRPADMSRIGLIAEASRFINCVPTIAHSLKIKAVVPAKEMMAVKVHCLRRAMKVFRGRLDQLNVLFRKEKLPAHPGTYHFAERKHSYASSENM